VNKELEVEVDGEGGASVLERCEGSGTGTGTYTWLSRSLTMTKRGGSGRIGGKGWVCESQGPHPVMAALSCPCVISWTIAA